LNDADTLRQLHDIGVEVAASTPEEFAAYMQERDPEVGRSGECVGGAGRVGCRGDPRAVALRSRCRSAQRKKLRP
jgi:hypothetical protein